MGRLPKIQSEEGAGQKHWGLSLLPTSEPAEEPASGVEAALVVSPPGCEAGLKGEEREPEWVGKPMEENQHV